MLHRLRLKEGNFPSLRSASSAKSIILKHFYRLDPA